MQPPQIPDHELLRRIGRGSYGEVWLGRNALGTLRAIKIVHRATFESVRPYEREFGGIQRFEPVSRSHDGLVDVLQVGRNEAEGFFYYVMELADPMDPPESSAYRPRTLAAEVERRGRLPVAEGLPIFLSLAGGLGHLHQRGLVHRDIKPSNIVFVSGVAKLADIGLVADFEEAASFVGTEGFIPPEGPGTRAADLYSLGKVIYEAATGLDRTAFPSLPTELLEGGEQESLLELNAVIMRACAPDPRQRYRSAEELAADLALLRSGQSLKRMRRIEQRLFQARRILGVAAVVTALAVLAGVGARLQAAKERRLRDRAESAEVAAREQLRQARINEARALRRGSFSGRREAALAALRDAARVRVDVELRSEAAACLALADLRREPDPVSFDFPKGAGRPIWAPGLERFVFGLPDGSLELRSARDGERVAVLRLPGAQPPDRMLTFSGRGRWLLASSAKGATAVWDLDSVGKSETNRVPGSGGLETRRRDVDFSWIDFGFSDDDRWLVFSDEGGAVRTVELESWKVTRVANSGRRVSAQPSPDGSHVAVTEIGGGDGEDPAGSARPRRHRVSVWVRDGWRLEREFEFPLPVHGLVWVDAERMAVLLSDSTLRVVDTRGGRPEVNLSGHKGSITEFGPLAGGALFFTASWDGTQRLWDVQSGTEWLRVQSPWTAFQFAADRRIGAWDERSQRLARAGLLGDQVVASLTHPRTDRANGPWEGGFDRTSRWFVSNDHDGARFWTVPDGRSVPVTEGVRTANSLFDPGSDGLLTSVPGRPLQRWRRESGSGGGLSFLPAEDTGLGPLDWLRVKATGAMAWHDAAVPGLVLRIRPRPGGETWSVEPGRAGLPRFRSDLAQYDISADGRWICLSPRFDHRAWLLESATGRLEKEFEVRWGAYMLFTPGGDRLLFGDQERYWLWDIAGRSNVWVVPRREDVGSSGRMAMTSDGRVFAVAYDREIVQLLDARDGRELLRLEHPLPEHISNLCFSADARYLAVLNETHVTHLWKLSELRRALAELGFGWEPGLEGVGLESPEPAAVAGR